MATPPTQPQLGSELYSQVSQQLNNAPGGAAAGYSGGQMPAGGTTTMGGGQLPVGGFEMPQMTPMGAAQQMGQNNPFGGGSSGFGGGGMDGPGDSLRKLVDTNKDLIAAIKDLTKNIKGIGGGGPGGMPGMPGLGGGGAGGGDMISGDNLHSRLLSSIARSRGAGGLANRYDQAAGGMSMAGTFGGGPYGGTFDHANNPFSTGPQGPAGGGGAFRSFGQSMANSPISGPNAALQYSPVQGVVGGYGQTMPSGDRDTITTAAYHGYAQGLGTMGPPGSTAPGGFGGPGTMTGDTPFRMSAGQALRSFGNALFPNTVAPVTAGPVNAAHITAAASYAAEEAASAAGLSGVEEQAARRAAEAMVAGNLGGIQRQADALAAGGKASRLGRGAGHFTRGAGRVIAAGGTNMSEIVSQIPYVGGILAAPLNVLEGRLAGAIPGELPGIIMSGYGQGGAQGSGFINTHSSFLASMRNNLGVGAVEALNMGNQVLNLASGGNVSGGLANGITAAIANGVNPGDVGVNASFGRAGMNLTGTGLIGNKSIRMALGMGLRGQGVSDFLGAVGGLGGQFGAMGIDLEPQDRQVARDISDIHRSGFSSLKGKLAVEGYSRMRQKGGIAAAQGLGGLFGGVANQLLMASALDKSGGNFDVAAADLEQLSPFENRQRLAQMMGVSEDDEVVQMLMMGQGLSYAERHIKRTSQGQISAGFGGGAQADAIFTKAKAAHDASRLTNTYGGNRTNIMELMRINKGIEDRLINGITVNKMEDLVNTVADVSRAANAVASYAAQAVGYLGQMLTGITNIFNWFSSGNTPPLPPSPPVPPSGPTASDIRLKKDIKLVGQSPSGLNIYEFKYIADKNNTVYSGVMAQEVMKVNPSAVGRLNSGYYGVYYDKIDVEFKEKS